MTVPARARQGALAIEVASANLFELAEQYLGDATQWDRIADLNGTAGVEPDFLIGAPTTLIIPRKIAAAQPAPQSIEDLLFGAGT